MLQAVSAESASSKHSDRIMLRRLVYHQSAFFLLHSIALSIFAAGFLLTRVELQEASTCTDLRDSKAALLSSAGWSANASTGCWAQQQFDKAVLVVIDALRFDVAVPPDGSPGEIPVLQQLAREAVCGLRAWCGLVLPCRLRRPALLCAGPRRCACQICGRPADRHHAAPEGAHDGRCDKQACCTSQC